MTCAPRVSRRGRGGDPLCAADGYAESVSSALLQWLAHDPRVRAILQRRIVNRRRAAARAAVLAAFVGVLLGGDQARLAEPAEPPGWLVHNGDGFGRDEDDTMLQVPRAGIEPVSPEDGSR